MPTIQLFTDYLVRLMKYVEFMKKVVPLHDDLFDFFYQALPGYEEVGRRRVLLACWGSFNDPDVCDYTYKNMTNWGRRLARGELDLEADLRSDTRSVLPLVETLIHAAGPGIRWMRDPTRGGAATSLNELARDCKLGMVLFEDQIPVRDIVRGACELLGLDPLHIANEGQFLAVVSAEYADAALNALSLAPGGSEARVIGEVREQPAGTVLVTTPYGGSRIVDMLVGDPLPRIC